MICRVVGEPVLKLNTGILKCQVEYLELFAKILKSSFSTLLKVLIHH